MKYTVIGKWPADTTSLPDKSQPFIIRDLTKSQIAAIPTEQYTVKVIGPTEMVGVVRNQIIGRFKPQRHTPVRRFGNPSSVVCYKTPTLAHKSQIGGSQDPTFTTLIQLLNTTKAQAQFLQDQDRERRKRLNRDNDDMPNSDIFYPPIDENEMADCIYKIIGKYFQGNDTGNVCENEYNLAQFCLLIHYFFRRINLLQNDSRQPFCNYLRVKVFAGEEKFTVKTFNNYANRDEFLNAEPILTNPNQFKTSFMLRPQLKGEPIKEAFQEIGWAFQHSEYFEELKKQKKNMNQFEI